LPVQSASYTDFRNTIPPTMGGPVTREWWHQASGDDRRAALVYALQSTLQTFLPNITIQETVEAFDAVRGYQPDYGLLVRQLIDTNSAGERADLTRDCTTIMQFLVRYHEYNAAIVARLQAQRTHAPHQARPPPRRAPFQAFGVQPGAAARAPRPAARSGGAAGPAGDGSTPRGAPVPGRASAAQSSVPVSAAGATAGDSSTPRGAPVPGKASAAQSSKASVASASFGSTPRGAPVAGRAGHAKSSKSSAPPGTAPKTGPRSA